VITCIVAADPNILPLGTEIRISGARHTTLRTACSTPAFMSFCVVLWRSACVHVLKICGGVAVAHTGAHTMGTSQKSISATDVQSLTHELTRENKPESPVVQALQRQVANAFVLYANYKHYHWQTYGPLFRDLHKLFDQLAEDVLPTLDELAERVRMIGQDPPAHLIAAADLASVTAAAPHSTMREMVEEGDRNLLVVIKEMRQAAKLADEHGDPGTVDIFSRLVQIHEKHEWFMRDMLRTGDGLCS
jgi:starvation-inducible DNA-binding protein